MIGLQPEHFTEFGDGLFEAIFPLRISARPRSKLRIDVNRFEMDRGLILRDRLIELPERS